MPEVKWIKITTDIFDNRKIKQIKKMPDGDAIIVIWFELLCLAGERNENGLLMFSENVPYTEELMANQFDRPLATVRLALETFQMFGMVEVTDDIMCVKNWVKYQNTDGLDKIREQTRKRVANYRDRQKQLACNVTSNVTVTQCNAIEEDIDIDKEKEKIYSLVDAVIAYLNQTLGTKYKSRTKKTVELIRARANEGFTLEDFKEVISKKASEWQNTDMAKFLRPETLFGTKFEGYLNQTTVKPKTTQFNDFQQRNNNWAALEAELLKK